MSAFFKCGIRKFVHMRLRLYMVGSLLKTGAGGDGFLLLPAPVLLLVVLRIFNVVEQTCHPFHYVFPLSSRRSSEYFPGLLLPCQGQLFASNTGRIDCSRPLLVEEERSSITSCLLLKGR